MPRPANRVALVVNAARSSSVSFITKQNATFTIWMHKPVKSRGIADLYQADLVDLLGIANYDSYCYLPTCIDIFTKKAWSIPLRSKIDREVTEAFRKILASSDRRPRMLQADNGTKFLNTTFQRMLTNNIHWYYTENKDIKVGIVECFNHTLKTKMRHYFTFKNGP